MVFPRTVRFRRSFLRTLYYHIQQTHGSPRIIPLLLTRYCRRRCLCTSTKSVVPEWREEFQLDEPELDWKYLCDPEKKDTICQNITNRKGVGDISAVISLWNKYNQETEISAKKELWKHLIERAKDIPNKSHPDSPIGEEDQARMVQIVGTRRDFDFKPHKVVDLGQRLGVLRTDNVVLTTGEKTYYFKHDLAKLEQALIQFTLDNICPKGFQLMTVPDMIHPDVIESCGFKTTGERTQVYKLDPVRHGNVCLAGTSEMPLAGYFMNEELRVENLPIKVAAVSRCYRAEASEEKEEQGIYRVHQFTKVEMFGVTSNETGEESDKLLEELVQLQSDIFTQLGLHFRILDMPTHELGAPAYRKYDVEAWMPAQKFWGEISSSSNCTDYQSRRLHIKYRSKDGKLKYAHTVNGTACAVPRMIMAILENNQNQDGSIDIPEALWPYMNTKLITQSERDLKSQWIRFKSIKSR